LFSRHAFRGFSGILSGHAFRGNRASFPGILRPGPTGQNNSRPGGVEKKVKKISRRHYALAREAAGFKFLSGLTLNRFCSL